MKERELMKRSVTATVTTSVMLILFGTVLVIGCGGGGGGGGGVGGNSPPVVGPPSLNPANVDFSGQPPVNIAVVVNDEDVTMVTVSAQVRRQSDGATFAIPNFNRNGGTFGATFNAPPNGGAAAQVYTVTLTVSDGVNAAVVVQAGANITVAPPEGAPPPPIP